MHYYGCYGEQTGKRWKRFKEVVEQQGVTEAQQEEFVDTALHTFRTYADCMKKALVQLENISHG
jgi:heme oxygenase